MADWPITQEGVHGAITSYGHNCGFGDYARSTADAIASGAWPAASRAIYVSFWVPTTVTARMFGWRNGAAVSGTMHVGIYDVNLAQLVTASATQAGTSSFQSIDITDTVLTPGNYFMAMALDNATGAVLRGLPTLQILRTLGVQQQASATPLPNPAVFANMATSYLPYVGISTSAVM